MKFNIVKKTDGLEIEISDVQGKKDQLLDAFQECAQGKCSCPTQEYSKLSELHVDAHSAMIMLRLTAKEGQQLDQTEIERCLDYTNARVNGRK